MRQKCITYNKYKTETALLYLWAIRTYPLKTKVKDLQNINK